MAKDQAWLNNDLYGEVFALCVSFLLRVSSFSGPYLQSLKDSKNKWMEESLLTAFTLALCLNKLLLLYYVGASFVAASLDFGTMSHTDSSINNLVGTSFITALLP